MDKEKIIAIDARMIESSGIGTYIKTCLKSGVYKYALGDPEIIKKYDEKIEVIPFTAKIYGIKEQLFFPRRKLKKIGIDVLHVPHYNISLFYRGKTITTIHDLTHLYFPEFLPNKFARFYANFMLKKAAKKSDKIFTVSEFVKGEIVKHFNVSPEKVQVTYNSCNKEFHVKEKNEVDYLYKKYNIDENKKILLYVGNLKPHKNLETLVSAYRLINNFENVVLLLVGKAFGETSINALTSSAKKGSIVTTGAVSSKELIDLYNLADLFVFPSLSEGFGIPPLEAMACGTPVVCSNATSIPEVVGEAALTFDPKNEQEIATAINRVLSDETLATELINKGFERIKLFDEDKIITQIEKTLTLC